MSFDRRDFLKACGAASMVVGFTVSCSDEVQESEEIVKPVHDADEDDDVRHSDDVLDHEKVQWMLINPDSTATAFTGRTELGQGSKTVMTSAIAQGLKLNRKSVEIVLGDTDRCPDNGPTSGSSMTINVVWPFYVACQKIRERLLKRASEELGVSKNELTIQEGRIFGHDASRSVAIGELKFDDIIIYHIRPGNDQGVDDYKDPGIGNVLGPDIVTGKLKYVGDLFIENMQYGGFVPHPYHFRGLKFDRPNFRKAKRIPGVLDAKRMGRQIGVVANSFSALQKGLKAVEVNWKKPRRPQEYKPEQEIRKAAKLDMVIQDRGNAVEELKKAKQVFSETYVTHHTTHCPIETDTAIVQPGEGDERWQAWVSSQYPHMQREKVADKIEKPLEDIHVIGMPVGGGYGGKISNPVTRDTALLAQKTGYTLKGIYNRQNQFQQYCRMKDIVVLDLKTAVDASGNLTARKIDIMQDSGHGIGKLYKCPHSQVKHYRMRSNHLRAVIRGTSYVQSIFGLECHMDEVARQIGMDPLEFRLKNLDYDAHRKLLQNSAEKIGYGKNLPADRGIGMAVVNHGSDELGAAFVQVRVDGKSGEVTVEKICGTFDIGLVMNQRTCRMGIEGCFIWAIGFAMLEELEVDGYGIKTTSMWDYNVPRFEHTPAMEIDFMQVHPRYGGPRGVGEMPMVPVIAAIGNAIRDATGVRLRQLPLTKERMLAGLKNT
jgi:nicotinate dehydrogenase subunit B